MENTGRIKRGLKESPRRLLFGETANASIDAELRFACQVDKAHLVMLVEEGIVRREIACRLLNLIDDLLRTNFAALRDRVALRGLYLLYEDYLIQQLGAETGGVLNTARSRNDLNATILRLRLRNLFLLCMAEALRLQTVLLRRARRFADVVMPAYTHYQAAVPVTYGHYLAGIACALDRDINTLWAVTADLNYCPLGAGAAGGTTFAIQPERTAALLGFDRSVLHSIDAVASRDLILRLLSGATSLGITLSRLACDFLVWTTVEFNFISLPDHLVGSSSMMPQKRNPFLLEHVQGRSAVALGAFVNAATAMHGKPFGNSISVGTEAVAPVWGALESITQAILLSRLVIADASPNRAAMLQRALVGHTTATALSDRLVTQADMTFRSAHHAVGALLSEQMEQEQSSLEEIAARWLKEQDRKISLEGLDPVSVAQASSFGGGPGATSLIECLKYLKSRWSELILQRRKQAQKWYDAEMLLDATVKELCKTKL